MMMLREVVKTKMNCSGKLRFFYQDETRLGLKTITGRKITAKGVKPQGKVQWQFQAVYLYGVVAPETGEHFFFECTHLNSQCFQLFLELVSQTFPEDVLVLQLDNAGFHKANKLIVPDNIILMFQPPYCPESNAIEQVWQSFKRGLRWKLPASLDELRVLITERLTQMSQEVLASITARSEVLNALSVVNF